MTSTSFNIKPPEKYFSTRPNQLARQNKSIPSKKNVDFIGQCSINFTIKQNNKFESIFDSFSSKMLNISIKSERKRFKPLSALEVSQIKLKFEEQSQKRKERSLKSLLFSDLEQFNERKQRRRPSSRYRPNTAHRLSKSPDHTVQNQEAFNSPKQIKTETKQEQRIMLESTDFTVRSYSSFKKNKNEEMQRPNHYERKNSVLHSSLRTSKKGEEGKSHLFSNESLLTSTKPNKINQEHEIQIRLSLKSMSKSQQVQESSGPKVIEKWIKQENKRLAEVNKNQMSSKHQKEKRPILTGTKFKQNRMILKFDKRILRNMTTVNDPSLKVRKIDTMSSRVRPQTQFS